MYKKLKLLKDVFLSSCNNKNNVTKTKQIEYENKLCF